MAITAAIFDMDGLLIDSEPLWYEAAVEVFTPLGILLTPQAYASSVGLRTREFVAWWFGKYGISMESAAATEQQINDVVTGKIAEKGVLMPGVLDTLDLLRRKGLRIGLATSSPSRLIDVVTAKLEIRGYFDAFASAEHLVFGKPHPQVYLDCANLLQEPPVQCLCFEDSFHGMIAAKAARMACVAVPLPELIHQPRWQAADMVLPSLQWFNEEKLGILTGQR